tara:strand:+ start:1785 stop:2162 length:378 start_codon:yes stop_codon:yes gene_type:complete
MSVPNHLLYTKDHEWVEFKEDYAIIGITDYAQTQLGDVIFVEFPEIGEDLNSGSSFGEVEAVKTVSDLFAPISWKVLFINEEIEDTPDLVNSDPYKKGWLIKITPSKEEEKDRLMNFEEYQNFIS